MFDRLDSRSDRGMTGRRHHHDLHLWVRGRRDETVHPAKELFLVVRRLANGGNLGSIPRDLLPEAPGRRSGGERYHAQAVVIGIDDFERLRSDGPR
jgi:hypothetical protein